jgi:hypothetical protein
MGGLKRIAVYLGIVATISWIMVALSVAQTASLPLETPAHQTVPEAAGPGTSGGSSEPLSDKLDRSGGVIRPPAGVDPGLTQSPPQSGTSNMPVIPPPGTRGGEPEINPK